METKNNCPLENDTQHVTKTQYVEIERKCTDSLNDFYCGRILHREFQALNKRNHNAFYHKHISTSY